MRKLTKVTALVMCLIMLMSTCSALFINAYAATAPKFSLNEVSKSGNTVTYELKLESGSFNAIDFTFRASGANCTSITLAPEFSAGGVSNYITGDVSYANTTAFSKTGTVVATATFNVTGSSYSVDVAVTNCVITEGTNNINVTSGVKVENGDSGSLLIKILEAIVDFFIKIIDFISGLFSGGTAAA